jgi:anti-sigma factor RsiW
MMTSERPISEHEMHAYVDERLWPARHLEVQHCLQTQPELARRAAAYRAQRAALRSCFAAQADEPIPPELDLARLLAARLRQRHAWRRMASAVVLSLCIGGAAGWYVGQPMAPDQTRLAVSSLQQEAMSSHTVYAADRVHSVEVSGAEQDHLARWLSNRVRRAVAPPDLSGAGYKLLGGRLLATERGAAAALFMYDDEQGNRLSVMIRPMARSMSAGRADVAQGAVNLCSWIHKGIGYAVVAVTSDEALDRVADEISEQTGAPG